MDCEMGNQGEADQFCKADRLDNVGSLCERNFGGAASTIAPARTITLLMVGLFTPLLDRVFKPRPLV